MSEFLTQRNCAILLLAGMVATILAVLGFEHIGGYIPCKLCLAQREPYYAAMPVVVLALAGMGLGWPQYFVRGLMLVAALLMVYTLVLAAYHAGVEWRWWQGPSDCGATSGNISGDVGDLLSDLSSKRAPACEDAAGRFLGLSFAGWNVIASGVLAGLGFRAAMAGSAKVL